MVKLKGVVYVLHVFKKKSTKGIGMPKKDKERIESRFKRAISHHKDWKKKKGWDEHGNEWHDIDN